MVFGKIIMIAGLNLLIINYEEQDMLRNIIAYKSGIVIGFIIAFFLVCYQILSMKHQNRNDMLSSVGGIGLIVSVIIAGMVSGYIIENFIIKKYVQIGQIWGAIVGSILISPLSLYYGIIFGTVGGGIGYMLTSNIGLKYLGVYIGIFIAILLTIIIIECIGAIIGSIIGSFIQSTIK
ncbi:MAG: hypothetical protein AB1467_07225 [Candidatus Diapherotrites archaeon]